MGRTGAGLFLAVLMVAALGAGYLAVKPEHQTSTSMATTSQGSRGTSTSTLSTEESTMVSTVPLSGLELRVALNATSILAGHTLAANVTLFNTLNQSLSLSPFGPANSTNLIQSWDGYDFLCGYHGPDGYLASFAVFPDSVSAGNLSQASPLQIAAQAGLPCIGLVWPRDEVISFLPNSDNASIPGTYPGWAPVALNVTTVACIALPSGSPGCHSGTGLYGYWIASSTTICCPANSTVPKLFRYLTPGEYTLAAEDVWGQSLFAHFQVFPGPSPAESVANQESPFSDPDSPVIGITLANFCDVPISSVGAVLRFVPASDSNSTSTSYPFAFVVNSTDPLLPGQAAQDVRTLRGSLFDIGVSYPLTISGTLSNGTTFTYTQQVQFTNSVQFPSGG